MQLLRRLYITLLRNLRHQYLEDLLEMQAICTLLCGIHSPAQKQVWALNRSGTSCSAAQGSHDV